MSFLSSPDVSGVYGNGSDDEWAAAAASPPPRRSAAALSPPSQQHIQKHESAAHVHFSSKTTSSTRRASFGEEITRSATASAASLRGSGSSGRHSTPSAAASFFSPESRPVLREVLTAMDHAQQPDQPLHQQHHQRSSRGGPSPVRRGDSQRGAAFSPHAEAERSRTAARLVGSGSGSVAGPADKTDVLFNAATQAYRDRGDRIEQLRAERLAMMRRLDAELGLSLSASTAGVAAVPTPTPSIPAATVPEQQQPSLYRPSSSSPTTGTAAPPATTTSTRTPAAGALRGGSGSGSGTVSNEESPHQPPPRAGPPSGALRAATSSSATRNSPPLCSDNRTSSAPHHESIVRSSPSTSTTAHAAHLSGGQAPRQRDGEGGSQGRGADAAAGRGRDSRTSSVASSTTSRNERVPGGSDVEKGIGGLGGSARGAMGSGPARRPQGGDWAGHRTYSTGSSASSSSRSSTTRTGRDKAWRRRQRAEQGEQQEELREQRRSWDTSLRRKGLHATLSDSASLWQRRLSDVAAARRPAQRQQEAHVRRLQEHRATEYKRRRAERFRLVEGAAGSGYGCRTDDAGHHICPNPKRVIPAAGRAHTNKSSNKNSKNAPASLSNAMVHENYCIDAIHERLAAVFRLAAGTRAPTYHQDCYEWDGMGSSGGSAANTTSSPKGGGGGVGGGGGGSFVCASPHHHHPHTLLARTLSIVRPQPMGSPNILSFNTTNT